MKIRLPITLTTKQREVDASPARFKILKWGRRTGKTRYEAYWTAVRALTMPKRKHWYVTKTLSLAREEFWPHLMDLLPRDFIAKTDERLLNVKLTNGSIISCKSAEKEDNLRGRGLGSVVLDEAAFCRSTTWERILRPQLADHEGPALIGSSPKKGWFTTLFNEKAKGNDPDWFASHACIYDNPAIKNHEVEAIRSSTPLATWLQEYMAEEVAGVGQVYEEFSPVNVYDPSKQFPEVKTYVTLRGIDWGTSDPTGCAWVGISDAGHIVISDEHVQRGWDPHRQAEAIHSKSAGYSKISRTILDRTAFRKESNLTSVADQFRSSGLVCEPSEKDIESSIGIVKRFMRGDGVTPWLYVSARCEKLIEAWQSWEHGDHEPDIAAAARYAIVHAVVRHMTRLADITPTLSAPRNPISEADAQLLLAAKAIVVPFRKARSWSWDHSAGIPI